MYSAFTVIVAAIFGIVLGILIGQFVKVGRD